MTYHMRFRNSQKIQSIFISYTNQLFTFFRRFSYIGLDEGRTPRKNKQNGTVLPEMGLGSKYQQNENNDF